ncbi:MAG: hypothetical protein PHX25_00080 [Candidatus Pacebacteria bacterium]|nr:hypothetical protein [Candidatus Paceibacterota bacterium]
MTTWAREEALEALYEVTSFAFMSKEDQERAIVHQIVVMNGSPAQMERLRQQEALRADHLANQCGERLLRRYSIH